MSLKSPLCGAFLAAWSLLMAGCAHQTNSREGLDEEALPSEVRNDYRLFALRCSKCHSLARPLQSGITSDDFWTSYVARMRRQPASGIAQQDEAPILRFLHYYSTDQLQKRGATGGGT